MQQNIIKRLLAGDGDARWGAPLLTALVLGLGALYFYSQKNAAGMAAVASSFLAAGASLSVGAALGFLFGIPRAVSESNREQSMLDGCPSYQVNTNLEQVSDWLTKIIVGVGLVEATTIVGHLKAASKQLALAMGGESVPPSLAGAILIYFSIIGFMLCYLWTRLLLLQEFTMADRSARQSPEFFEGLIQALLYQPAPDGFTKALKAATEYLKRFGDGNWRIWRSIACANGQRYSFVRDSDPQEAEEAFNEALKALKMVLKLCPSEKESMMNLWDPAQATAQENDLVVFFDRPEFKATFGVP